MAADGSRGRLVDGRYELLEVVGSGGMSSVFRARDRVLDRVVAVKVLDARLGRESEFVERFHREARAVAGLSHPNIVAVIDRGVSEGREFIVFEFIDGEDLGRMLKRTGALPVGRALEVVLDVAAGLSFAHDQGLVHRDVKPQNILLNSRGEAKVTDFGIARRLDGEHGMTQTGSLLGTSAYLSPEQAAGRPVSPASDVYSLGVVLFQSLTGDVPFHGEGVVAVAMKHLNEPPPRMDARRPDLPARLTSAVDRALAKDPADRFSSMRWFAAELERCHETLDGADLEPTMIAMGAGDDGGVTRRVHRPSRSRPAVVALVGVLLAVAAAAVGLIEGGVFSGSPERGTGGPPSAHGASGSAVTAVALQGIGDYNPSGPPDTHADTASLATSGDSTTGWYTQIYATPDFGNLMPGLGLLLDAGHAVRLARIAFRTSTPGFTATILAGDSPQGTLKADSAPATVGPLTSFALEGATARYYVLWITRLPPGGKADVTGVSATA